MMRRAPAPLRIVMSHTSSRLPLAIAYMMVMGALWGLQFSLSKTGAQHGIAPAAWMLFVNGVGAPVLLAIAAWRGSPPGQLRPHVRYALWAGFSAVALPNTLVVLVMAHVPAGLAAVLNTLSPLMTYALALAFGMAAVHRLRVAGLACGLAGAWMVLGPRASLPDPAMGPWVALCLLVPLSYAVSNIYIARHRPAGVDSIALAGAMQLGSFACLLPLALWQGVHLPLPPAHAGDWALLLHAALSWIGSLLFFEVMRLAGPVFFSQTGFLVTLWGVFWGWLLFGETHSAWVWGAMLAIFAGLALVTRAGR
jgi:drug/metabolite transporter (DMT)-like permease